jgi:hypothetical protein
MFRTIRLTFLTMLGALIGLLCLNADYGSTIAEPKRRLANALFGAACGLLIEGLIRDYESS